MMFPRWFIVNSQMSTKMKSTILRLNAGPSLYFSQHSSKHTSSIDSNWKPLVLESHMQSSQ